MRGGWRKRDAPASKKPKEKLDPRKIFAGRKKDGKCFFLWAFESERERSGACEWRVPYRDQPPLCTTVGVTNAKLPALIGTCRPVPEKKQKKTLFSRPGLSSVFRSVCGAPTCVGTPFGSAPLHAPLRSVHERYCKRKRWRREAPACACAIGDGMRDSLRRGGFADKNLRCAGCGPHPIQPVYTTRQKNQEKEERTAGPVAASMLLRQGCGLPRSRSRRRRWKH
jgi:hypothetical protein